MIPDMFGLILHVVDFLSMNTPVCFSSDFTIVKSFCQRAWGRKSLHMDLPWRSMWQGGGFITGMWNWKCKWHPRVGAGAATSSAGAAVPPLACFLLLCLRSICRYLRTHPVKKAFHWRMRVGCGDGEISVLETLWGAGREKNEIVAQWGNLKINKKTLPTPENLTTRKVHPVEVDRRERKQAVE